MPAERFGQVLIQPVALAGDTCSSETFELLAIFGDVLGGLNITIHIAQTRTPFRAAAFILGMVFVGFGLFEILGGATGWVAYGIAGGAALMGVQFVRAAITGQWQSLSVWQRRETAGQMPSRFLTLEPPSFGCAAINDTCRSDSLDPVRNPYAPPVNLPEVSLAVRSASQEPTLPTLSRQFLDGYPFIHEGVVIFLEGGDDTVIHAALPLAAPSESRKHYRLEEAIRVLLDFLKALPSVQPLVADRTLVVRMISSYSDLDDEVCDRSLVPWATIWAGDREPAEAREPTTGPTTGPTRGP